MFDLKKSKINRGVNARFFLRFLKGMKIFSFLAFLLSFGYFVYGFIADDFPLSNLEYVLFLVAFFFSLFLLLCNFVFFFENRVRRSKKIDIDFKAEKDDVNLADFLSIHAATRIKKAIGFAKKNSLNEPNSSILLYFILKERNRKIDFILNRLLISKKALLLRLKKEMLYTKDEEDSTGLLYNLEAIILEALKSTIRRKGIYIKTVDIFSALSKIEPVLKEELRRKKFKKQDVDNLNFWQERLLKRIRDGKKWWSKKNLAKYGTLARDWASGWTPTLDRYSADLTSMIQVSGFLEAVGHETERSQAERVLIRDRENNVLLVGENGVGRISIIRSIAQRSYLNKGFKELQGKRFIELDMPSILTSTSSIDEVEALLDKCFKEAALASNIVLVLTGFDNYINEKTNLGVIDMSSLIIPYLKYSEFRFIAITSYKGLHRYIELKPQILSLFEKIEVKEASKKETLLILQRQVLFIENKYKIFVTYPALIKIIELSDKYVTTSPFPKKAEMLLNDVAIYTSSNLKDRIILEEHVEKVISEKTDIPVGKISESERDVLLNMENLIHKRVINQVEAVNEISASLRRARSGIKTKNGPMGTFLFLGPTGVGKTETAKALAEVYFGSETKMIRFDMSEFQTIGDIKRFIGEGDLAGLLATNVRENPFSLVLFDEIEKAHPNILNLFLQILDEGYMTDSLGRKIDFSNTIIIATSNAGYQIILNAIKEEKSMQEIKQEILDHIFEKAIFRPEFINRFDATVVFKALTKNNLVKIADLRFKKLQKNLTKKQITLNVPEKTKMKIVELSYNPQFGAREIRRVIQDKIENALAKAFLMETIKEGDTILINEDFEVLIEKRDYEE